MKKINDVKLYLYFSIITAAIGIILTLTYAYSAYMVEPDIEALLEKQDNISENYKAVYLKLKDPQIFARYENYDSISRPIESIITVFDKKITDNEAFEENDRIYLHILLERRKMGALLTRNTFIFFYAISVLGWIFFISEIIQDKKTNS
ncbi:MAG: hypothetical protein MUC95_02310 [Spirochaetes bacterium]|jgi:hypothetical protein|nr:hypothetical protein [Spirochaetota bacterium]